MPIQKSYKKKKQSDNPSMEEIIKRRKKLQGGKIEQEQPALMKDTTEEITKRRSDDRKKECSPGYHYDIRSRECVPKVYRRHREDERKKHRVGEPERGYNEWIKKQKAQKDWEIQIKIKVKRGIINILINI